MQWRSSTAKMMMLTLFCVMIGCPATAHGGDITRAELREKPDGLYQLEVDLPDALAGNSQQPELPSHCSLNPNPEGFGEQNTSVMKFEFNCGGVALSDADTLILPWKTAGGLVVVYWEDGSSNSKFFAPGNNGVTVVLAQLRQESRFQIATLQRYTLLGLKHILVSPNHWLLLVGLALIAPSWGLIRLVTAFSIGHLLSVALAAVGIVNLPLIPAELSLVLAAIAIASIFLLKKQAKGSNWTMILVLILGLLHGLGWAGILAGEGIAGSSLVLSLLAFNIGVDAAQLLLAAALAGAIAWGRTLPPQKQRRRLAGYSLGILAIATLFLPRTEGGNFITNSETIPEQQKPLLNASEIPPRTGQPPQPENVQENTSPETTKQENIGLKSPLMSFVTIEPLEVRHEILVSVSSLASWLELEGQNKQFLEIEEQEALKQRLSELLSKANPIKIDGVTVEPIVDRINFVTVGAKGTLAREMPIREKLDQAIVGVVLAYLTPTVPEEVVLQWDLFSPQVKAIATTITDPETSKTQWLRPEQPLALWQNELPNFALPSIEAIAVQAPQLPFPVVSVLLIVSALLLDTVGLRTGSQPKRSLLRVTRIILPVAIFAYPLVVWSIPLRLPFQSKPSPTQAAFILDSLLTNVYRAFEFRNEEDIYDKLAISVTGEQLTEIYLESRRSLEVENRGGARAQVEEVDVTEVTSVSSAPGGKIIVQAEWRVGGSVSHFGHTHFRHNQYVALVTMSFSDSVWKINEIELIDEHRLL